ncbi:hypothetical protein QEZ54_14665 [Catellatospora sp. KI3]|uniref:hypothetical protein n=1 Tax=Catellatospora sp. KI3 TaxID=3041620 RepID=UPI002482201D|nr:hypothetical protein [Catellatospora sp. KI3]MDI1462209.1 hypothetical protein [Catellatospora sp. KI3]
MKAHPPSDPSERAELAALLPDPGYRELPPGRHGLHRQRLLAAITEPPRRRARPRPALLRPALALASLVAIAGVVVAVVTTTGRGPVTADPTPAAASGPPSPGPTEQGGTTAKVRAYGTVRQLTEAADLVVRGEVVRAEGSGRDRTAALRVAEVLRRGEGLPDPVEITLSTPELAGMSRLEPGQHTVLYLAAVDARAGVYTPLSGDFGVFDVVGGQAVARSQTMAVTGLREEDATAPGRRLTVTLDDLRALAREVG